ncbi:uncharacterized protein LOC106762275 isoform X2 [Vigna radiata var. radiata]|uniref:Uncharacterized protein LOC106762275 isoform X2 n=1 Tax=Vigna radiata var. radiata TaxID=3916 RepID=A0A1S3U6E4_VIGRR|nr:uncharacterized protein LOC106762275 isoform X2 [Vigna radiata var. radiata]
MESTVMDCSPSSSAAPPRRSGRRKLVQSTLFPLKPPEPVEKKDKEDELDEDYSEAKNNKKRKRSKAKATPPIDEDYSEAENNKKRKMSKAKATPPKKGSSKRPTPKKKATANGTNGSTSKQVLANSDQVKAPVFDLFLEAKLAAEEDSRIYAGRQVHPFFSLWKEGKKVHDVNESGSNLPTTKSKHKRTTCGPIHVFENVKDDTSSVDWRNWTFMENITSMNYGQGSVNSSVLEGSVESLNFDKLHSFLNPSGISISQNALSPSNPSSLAEQSACLTCGNAELDTEVDESVTPTVQAGIFRKSKDTEPLNRFLQESMRSYYRSCLDLEECHLWTYKYKPTKAVEVCGNDESVNFLSDWLHRWHERQYKSRKDNTDTDKSGMQDVEDDDDDYKCSYSDCDSEDMNEKNSLKNVLLITGPIGSGKSSAVHACAKEQGFVILEFNSSHSTNGTAIRNLEHSLNSLGFKSQSGSTASSHKISPKSAQALAMLSGKAADEVNGVDELITISDDEARSHSGSTLKLHGENNDTEKYKIHRLVLVEDVDILFAEDRGCIAAIQQIAETSKGPIILTSNSDNPGLRHKFDMLHVPFVLPSPKELLCHLYSVCLTEGVNIHPLLLEKFIHSCDGDIRKIIMHLQFWFQSKIFKKDEKAQTGYGSLPFDLELAHEILPKMMPWDFPSVISDLIENKIAKQINIMEENSKELVTEKLHISERHKDLNVNYTETDDIEAMKAEMINRNGLLTDYFELEIQRSTISEFSNSSGSPLASSRHGRRKLVVMSSDSEDDNSNCGYPVDSHDEANTRQLMKENNGCPSEFLLNGNYPDTSVDRLVCSDLEHSEDEDFKYLEMADGAYLNETCKSLDVSCVPESTFVPETEIENGTETLSGAVSSGPALPFVSLPEVSVNNELKPFNFNVRRRLTKLSQNPDLLADTEIPDHSFQGVLPDVQDEHTETLVKVMDECSRMDFKPKPTLWQSNPLDETEKIQNVWRDLRDCRVDLRQHSISEELGVLHVVKLASGLCNLISDADLFPKWDRMEPSMFLSNEAASHDYCEQMMSTVAEHGFCFYAKLIADEGSKLGCANCADITSEMLASSTDIMALGKLSRHDLSKMKAFRNGNEVEWKTQINNMQKSEKKRSLIEVIQSIAPPKTSLALKGYAFNEYLSSLRHISRSEAFRISQVVEKKRGGRVRGVHHYLSTNTKLSPEEISLVTDGDPYRKISSQHTT